MKKKSDGDCSCDSEINVVKNLNTEMKATQRKKSVVSETEDARRTTRTATTKKKKNSQSTLNGEEIWKEEKIIFVEKNLIITFGILNLLKVDVRIVGVARWQISLTCID